MMKIREKLKENFLTQRWFIEQCVKKGLEGMSYEKINRLDKGKTELKHSEHVVVEEVLAEIG